MTIASLNPSAPREIRHALARVAVRLRTVGALKGLGTVALVGSLGAIAGMIADFAWPLPSLARWGIWTAWLAMTTLTAAFGVIRPLFRPLAPIELAALAERGQPELGESLVGSVALLAEGDRTHGSRALIDALAGQAAAGASAIDARRAVTADRAVRRLAVGLALVGLVALPPMIRLDPFGTLARRFFAPWLDLDRVGRFVLRVNPGDKIVAIGSDLAINARLSPRAGLAFGALPPDAAWLEWDDEAGKSTRVRMASKDSGARDVRLFEARLPHVSATIRYRVVTEPAKSRRYELKAVEPPALASISARVEPPTYTKLPAGPARDPMRLDVVEGSALTFTLVTNRPVQTIQFAWPTFTESDEPSRPAEVTIGPDGKTATVHVTADNAGSYTYATQIKHDEYALNGPRESRKLVVRPDNPPVLTSKPVEAKESGADDVLTVPLVARDDFAVASAELHYALKRDKSEAEPETGKVNVALQGLGSPRASGEAALGLKSLSVHPGDVITYKLKISDNRPAPKGPNVTWSDEGTLTIVAKAEPILARRDRLRREAVQERLEAIKKDNLANRQETTQLRYASDAAQRTPASWDKTKDQALADRETAARKVTDDLNALARDLDADPTYRALARPTKEIADVEAEAGHAAIGAARRAPDAAKRLGELKGADSRLGAVHTRIEELQRKFEVLAKIDTDRQKLRELAAREDALASEAAKAGDDKAQLDALRAEQDDVRKDLDALANQSPELKAGLLEAQAKEAADLAQKARDLAARQREEARKTTEGTKREAALKALAEAQRQIEIDARKLALNVDQPLAENGRSGLNAQVLQNAVAPIERGEITPARQRLEEGEAELRRIARDAEDAPADPKAFVRRLMRRQDELANHVAETVREAKGKNNPTPKEQADLAEALKPLVAEQDAILKLTEAIKVDEPRKGAARDASQAVARALENLKGVRPKEAEGRQNEAKQALNRLADALPEAWQRDEPARKALEEARRMAEEGSRDLDRHLRETAAEPGKPSDPAKAAADLANRLAPMAQKEAEAAKALASMDVPARVEPQLRRAERRVKALAEEMKAIQTLAEPLAKLPPSTPGAIRDWQVVGPFAREANPPFSLKEPIKTSASFKDLKGKSIKFIAAKGSDDHGKLNLGAILSKESERSAFAYAEIESTEAGTAKFTAGFDDTIAVWVNGKQVYKVDGNHSYSPDQATFDVALPKGKSRIVVRCGNNSDEWQFGVAVAPPRPISPELARIETLRAALPQAQAEARAALDRLTQKLHNQASADDAAQELAAEQAQLAQDTAKPDAQAKAKADPDAAHDAAGAQRRLAAALRVLTVPDAPVLKAEAVRLADAAAKALDAPNPAAPDAKAEAAKADAVKDAAEAAKALADRLADQISPRAEAAALAKAERAMNADPAAADLPAQALEQAALAAEAARIEADTKPDAAQTKARPALAAARAAELTTRAATPYHDPNRPRPTPAELAAARAEAAAKLDALAARAPAAPPLANAPPHDRRLPDAPRDPALAPLPALAAEARALAIRERQVREKLQAILGERVAPQEELRHQSVALGQEFADLRDRSREAGPHGHGHANNAADLLANQAPHAMNQGINELAQGHPDTARDTQRRAADLVERAAQAAEDLAQALKTDIPADAAQAADLAPARDALAEARAHLAQEGKGQAQGQSQGQGQGQGEPQPAGQAASDAMQRAAQAMRTAARSAPGRDEAGDDPTTGEGATLNPKSTPAGVVAADLSQLQAMVRQKTGRTWGELPGHLRTEILQLSQGKYRDDYARLIQLYFREIASDASRPETP
jgi:hypothetical protein